ncbi:levanase/fructan beta-fructosidase [Arachidicoccus rhizosphaerae]|uniref:Levanase/fructan beta-fructosidase n=1 Tax=Arachidicoccus rhizosphaerae TaxID=551991 RepID=A0A1H4D8C4_9BACT|nr:glycoside hydrolase family 32 protein [Arachidicoccus rhizosphaerae]SEA68766.1 levanase/fructan beta-fructosidase [Arachidicoccus rhizosphaerae]
MTRKNLFKKRGFAMSVLLIGLGLIPFTSQVQAQVSSATAGKLPTEQYRPVYHFTPLNTWTNDPNGLFYKDGVYHLYYQNNPFDNVWGHMSWGHATSKDLVHWQHLPVAIPEINKPDTTISIFSGSAVIDPQNTSGFGQKGKAPIVAIFTGDLPKQKKQAQYIAYSNDNGNSFSLYTGDPVIDINRPDFRDPNVFWYAPSNKWIMAVSLVHEHKIRFYGSENLKNWEPLSDFGPAGYTGHDWECPALFQLPVEATANGKENAKLSKWVLLVSCWGTKGPYMQYFIGEFDGKTFHNDNPADLDLTVDDGDCFYAAIPWHLGMNRKTLLGWLVPGKVDVNPWRGQMSIPRDLSLRRTPEGIRLYQRPAALISKNLSRQSKGKKISLTNISLNNNSFHPVSSTGNNKNTQMGNAYWAEATIDVNEAQKAGFNIAQDSLNNNKVVVGYDAEKQLLYVDFSA